MRQMFLTTQTAIYYFILISAAKVIIRYKCSDPEFLFFSDNLIFQFHLNIYLDLNSSRTSKPFI